MWQRGELELYFYQSAGGLRKQKKRERKKGGSELRPEKNIIVLTFLGVSRGSRKKNPDTSTVPVFETQTGGAGWGVYSIGEMYSISCMAVVV